MENLPNNAKELTALDLNNIKLDAKHTVLSPQYLENLIASQPSTDNPME